MESKEEIFNKLKEVLEELFEIDPADVSLSSQLYTDLDLDSIDAVDLVIKLKEITGKVFKPEEFKLVRSVEDVVEAIDKLLHEK